jgi:hypothetical protein
MPSSLWLLLRPIIIILAAIDFTGAPRSLRSLNSPWFEVLNYLCIPELFACGSELKSWQTLAETSQDHDQTSHQDTNSVVNSIFLWVKFLFLSLSSNVTNGSTLVAFADLEQRTGGRREISDFLIWLSRTWGDPDTKLSPYYQRSKNRRLVWVGPNCRKLRPMLVQGSKNITGESSGSQPWV